MLSARPSSGTDTVDRIEANVLADGLFHLVALAALVAGTVILRPEWRHGRLAAPWGVHIGLGLAGWATFNLVEGVVNHHLLGIHHVREDVQDVAVWDAGFLGLSGPDVGDRTDAVVGDEDTFGHIRRLTQAHRGYDPTMTNAADENPTTNVTEPGTDSTVSDWHGQEVERDARAADAALTMADGDETAAEKIFEEIRPDHPSDEFKVPAEEREATLVSPPDAESDD